MAELVEEIKSKEEKINILVHSAGSPDFNKIGIFAAAPFDAQPG